MWSESSKLPPNLTSLYLQG